MFDVFEKFATDETKEECGVEVSLGEGVSLTVARAPGGSGHGYHDPAKRVSLRDGHCDGRNRQFEPAAEQRDRVGGTVQQAHCGPERVCP